MSSWLVLEDFGSVGSHRYTAGQVIESDRQDVPFLRSQGLSVIPYFDSYAEHVAGFLSQRRRKGQGSLHTLLSCLGRWDDFRPNTVSVGTAAASLTVKAPRAGLAPYQHFRRDQDDLLIFSFQMPHPWLVGTDVRPHVHGMPVSAVAGDDATSLGSAYFKFRWAWTGIGSGLKLPVSALWSEEFVSMPVTIGDQFEELVKGPLITPPESAGLSSHLHVELTRLGLSAAEDDYESDAENGTAAANFALISVDCHGLVLHDGSLAEFHG